MKLPVGYHPGRANTILVVEDEASVRALARRVLERSGYAVLDAENGRAALRMFLDHAESIDLVVTDVVMPEMDGRHLVERLRTERPDLAVMYMSGYTEDEVVRRGVAKGDPFLGKPFTPADLVRKCERRLAPWNLDCLRSIASPSIAWFRGGWT